MGCAQNGMSQSYLCLSLYLCLYLYWYLYLYLYERDCNGPRAERNEPIGTFVNFSLAARRTSDEWHWSALWWSSSFDLRDLILSTFVTFVGSSALSWWGGQGEEVVVNCDVNLLLSIVLIFIIIIFVSHKWWRWQWWWWWGTTIRGRGWLYIGLMSSRQ